MRGLRIYVFAMGIAGLAAAQLVQPSVTARAGKVGRDLLVSPDLNPQVRSILTRSCADCHSDHIRLPWYGRVSPVSWVVTRDIGRGREKLDFSDWPRNSANLKQDIADAVDKGNMPLRSYLWMHHDARLSSADRQAIYRWADSRQ